LRGMSVDLPKIFEVFRQKKTVGSKLSPSACVPASLLLPY
jgi:hypothetical protein